MKKNIKYFAMAAVALLSMSACTNEIDEQSTPTGELQPVQFEMTMANTRTVTDAVSRNTSWKEGDAIGIFAYKAGTQEAKAINAKYVLNGEIWKAEAGSEIYPEEALDYYAYYPYQEGMENPEAIDIAALADQSVASGDDYGMSDVLAGQSKDVAAGQGNVKIPFSHMFAMVEVKVEGDKVTKQPTKVELKGVKLNAVLNIMSATPTATVKSDATAQDITMYYLSREGGADAQVAPFSFRAVVPAQEIAANTPLVAIYAPDENNKTYTMQHSEVVPYKAGVFRQLNVNIGTAKVSLTIPKGDLTISPWEPSDAIGGEGGEVIPNYIEEFKDDAFTTSYKDLSKMTSETDTWFAIRLPDGSKQDLINLAAAAIFSVSEAEEEANSLWSKQATLTVTPTAGAGNSWYVATMGYYHATPIDVTQTTIYKLTFKAKISNNEAKGIQIACRNAADNGTFQIRTNTDFISNNATLINVAASDINVWEEKTVYINFAKLTTGSPVGTPQEETITTDADYAKCNIRIYPQAPKGKGETTLSITDVKLEPYIVE